MSHIAKFRIINPSLKKGKVGKDQEKKQSYRESHSNNRGGEKLNQQLGTDTMATYRKPNEQLFFQ